MDRRTLLNVFLGLLMATSMLAGLPGANAQLLGVSPAHLAAVQNEPGQSDGAPYGTWTKAIERVSFYAHRDAKLNASDTPLGADTLNNDLYYLDYERPKVAIADLASFPIIVNAGQAIIEDLRDPNDKKVAITSGPRDTLLELAAPFDNYARFVVPIGLTATEDIRLYRFEVDAWANCAPSAGFETPRLRAQLELLDFVNGAWVRRDFSNDAFQNPYRTIVMGATAATPATSTGTFRFQGNTAFGNAEIGDGLLLKARTATDPGTRLQVSFLPGDDNLLTDTDRNGACILHFDTTNFPTKVLVDSDSARLNTWVENREGDFTEGLPTPIRASAAERRFFAQVVHVSAWPHLNSYFNPRTDTATAPVLPAPLGAATPNPNDDNTPVDYQDDFWDLTDGENGIPNGPGNVVQATDLRIRIRDLDTLGFVQGTNPENILQVERKVVPLGDSANRIEYTYFYPASLPEHPHRVEAFSTAGGVAVSPTVTFGLKGFTVTALDNATHRVNPGQATEFRFNVRNFGTEDDSVTVVANPPGGSWSAEIVGGSSHFLKANGGQAEVVLRVTPAALATAGQSREITFTASSANFANEVTPVTKAVNVTLVSAVTRGVDVTSTESLVLLQPGTDTAIAGVRVTNTGSQADLIGLTPVLPASAAGWTVQATPLSRNLAAASSGDFSVRIRAPLDAPAGQTFLLGLVGQRLGDSSVSDRVDVTITVQVKHSFLVETIANPIAMRDNEYCPPAYDMTPSQDANDVITTVDILCLFPGTFRDTDADLSVPFRLSVSNLGPVEDTYKIIGNWVTSGNVNGVSIVDDASSNSCDSPSGRPDDWTFEFGNASQIDGTPGKVGASNGVDLATTVKVPAKTTVPFYFDLGYTGDGFCASMAGAFTILFQSTLDPGNSQLVRLGAYRSALGDFVKTNEYTGGVHNLSVEADVTDLDAKALAQPGTEATHLVRVVNRGNEKDDILVQVPASSNGWTKSLEFVSSVPAGQVTCSTLNPSNTRFVCPMGAFDEALFKFKVKPDASLATGLTDRSLVSVSSGDDGRIGDSLEFSTSTVGTFQFVGQVLDPIHDAERGRSAQLPFVLRNLGTQSDTLNLSIAIGDANWQPRLGVPTSIFVPAGRDVAGFLSVTVPDGATANQPFRVQVSSQGNGVIQNLEFTVRPVAPSALQLFGIPTNMTTLAQTGVPVNVTVGVTDGTTASGRVVTVTPSAGALPSGWTVTPASRDVTLASGSGEVTFAVTAPAGALSSSRVPLVLKASSSAPTALDGRADLLLQLADTFGVRLDVDGVSNQTIVPGGEVVYTFKVANVGTSTDTVRLTTAGAPDGWLVQPDPPELALGPLETRTVQLIVNAPVNAVPRALANTTLQATSLGGASVSYASVLTTVGFYQVNMTAPNGTVRLAPNEHGSYVLQVTNNGTLPDEVVATMAVVNPALASALTFTSDPAVLVLEPGQTREVRLDVLAGPTAPSDTVIAFTAKLASRLDPVVPATNQTAALNATILRYVAADVDRDGVQEYAIDRDLDAGTGFESFADSTPGGGKATRVANLTGYLTDAAKASFTKQVPGPNGTTTEVFDFVLDGDGDGRADLLLDSTGDGLPDHYWDPDRGTAQDLTVFKDINVDQVPDYFIDATGDGDYDTVYDLRTGTFTPLLQLDVDGDGELDYAVDANRNGKLDDDETVLYSRSGGLITVLKLDVDGDGEKDDVFDTDGDGQPDFFVPAGEESPVEIVLRDANGDGKADWTYDSNNDGRVDSYYDPATGKTGVIDSGADFVDALRDHWYIGALFALVLVLFVALVAVTRR